MTPFLEKSQWSHFSSVNFCQVFAFFNEQCGGRGTESACGLAPNDAIWQKPHEGPRVCSMARVLEHESNTQHLPGLACTKWLVPNALSCILPKVVPITKIIIRSEKTRPLAPSQNTQTGTRFNTKLYETTGLSFKVTPVVWESCAACLSLYCRLALLFLNWSWSSTSETSQLWNATRRSPHHLSGMPNINKP